MKGFTPEELALLRAADEKIEQDDGLTAEEVKASVSRDAEARWDRVDRKKAGKLQYQKEYATKHARAVKAKNRKYYEANRERLLAQSKKYSAEHAAQVRERKAAWYAANRERIRRQQRKYNQAHAEEIRANKRRYAAAHTEEIRERRRAYVDAHREEIRAREREWYAKNREAISAKRKAAREEKKKNGNGKAASDPHGP